MKTKRMLYILSIGLLCWSVLSLVSCMDDDWAKTSDVVEGVPITVNLKFSGAPAADVVVDTRADNSRSWLNNLTIYIYGSDGKWQQTVSTTDGTLTLGTRETLEGSGVTYGVTFSTTSGEKKLLAMGNRGGGFWKASSSINVQTMSFDELEKYLLALSVEYNSSGEISTPIQIVSSDQMLITGKNAGITFDEKGEVTDWGEGESTRKIAVKMDRSMARITFNIAANPTGANGTFTPTSYKVYNVPIGSYLTNEENSLTPESVTFKNFASTPISPASGEEGNEQFSFSFYMPENICMTKELDSYQDRDRWKNGDKDSPTSPENKIWENAPLTSTFVVISGIYSGSAYVNGNPNTPVTGNVDYTIHLGDFSVPPTGSGSMGNFSVERNVSYTYNVTVKGVDKIVVEVTTDNEEQPGAEGEIYDNETTVYNYNLDAHYEQVYLEYNLSKIVRAVHTTLAGIGEPSDDDIKNAIAQHLILSIRSDAMGGRVSLQPYKLATVDNATKEEAMEGVDYRWVEFYPQTSADELTPYPGTPTWSQSYIDGTTDPSTENVDKVKSMMDVYEVIVAMGKAINYIYNNPNQQPQTDYEGIKISQNSNNDYTARFTAFVNEYYYYKDPLTDKPLTSWSAVTNKNPREMIIAMNSENSYDGNSSYNQIHSYISQLSMETIYNEGWNAFGIETYNETPLTFEFNDTKDKTSNLDDSDGRENQIRLLGESPAENGTYGNWDTYLNIKTNGWFGSVGTDHGTHKLNETAYQAEPSGQRYAYSACLSRNRDLNGNGKIDDNEVRWYLASINEYIRMGIGTRAISNAAQLFIGNKDIMTPEKNVNGVKTGYPHDYINSGSLFYTSSDANKRVYWAVERGSYGTINYGGDKALPIRCVRVLPKDDMAKVYDVKADPTFEVTQYEDGYPKVLKFKGHLVDGLYRERTDGVLDSHNEDQPMNAYSEGIIISSNTTNGNMTASSHYLYDIFNYGEDAENPCKDYHEDGDGGATWRVPNLSELSAMNAAKGTATRYDYAIGEFVLVGLFDWVDSSTYPICASCTHFRNMNVRSGFGRNVNYVYAIDQYSEDALKTNTARVRCVRDVPAGYTFPTN